jgi:outer membrane protein OmpA-like peptidoglycan-associated protein
LFCVKPEMICITQHSFKHKPSLVELFRISLTCACQCFHEPEGAHVKCAFLPGKPVNARLRGVTVYQAVADETSVTRDSARGLIVSMSDVLFDTGKYSLKPGAREKLAKVAGILLAYPGLNIAVGGYTDNVGGDAMNQELSENRAGSVRDYLVQQGVATTSVSAQGFGNSMPVASNNDSAGRQQNRRVELLVSGEAIGKPVNATTGSLR